MKFIETWKKRRLLRKYEFQYSVECDDLACYRRSLKKAIRRGDDKLSTILRQAIADSQAECNRLSAKIKLIIEWLKEAKKHNSVMTTG